MSRSREAAELYLRGGVTLKAAAAQYGLAYQTVHEVATRIREERSAVAGGRSDGATPSLPQTIVLLAYSRGARAPVLPPHTRIVLLKRQWIAPPRPFTITAAGRDALAASPWIEQAQKAIDQPPLPPARSGMSTRR